eukprot:4731544-Prymnesium_polylepis.1
MSVHRSARGGRAVDAEAHALQAARLVADNRCGTYAAHVDRLRLVLGDNHRRRVERVGFIQELPSFDRVCVDVGVATRPWIHRTENLDRKLFKSSDIADRSLIVRNLTDDPSGRGQPVSLAHTAVRARGKRTPEQDLAVVAFAHRVQIVVIPHRVGLRVHSHRLVLHLVRRLGNFMRHMQNAEAMLLLTH